MPAMTEQRKGLRFEVEEFENGWQWTLIGADGPIAMSVREFATEKHARSHIHANKGRLKAAGYAKVVTIIVP